MALIGCSECGNEISNKATSCPHCGSPTELAAEKAAEDTVGEIGCALVSLLVLLFIPFFLFITYPGTPEPRHWSDVLDEVFRNNPHLPTKSRISS